MSNPIEQSPFIEQPPNVLTAFSLAANHSDPYTHDTLSTHPLPFPRTVRKMSPLSNSSLKISQA